MGDVFPVALPDFLEEADDEIRIRGHRITLYHVLTRFNDGMGPEEIVLHFPTIKISTVYRAIAFYLDHQQTIDAYLAAYRRDLDEQAAAPSRGPSRAELLRRLEQIRLKANNAAHVPH
jgi:uncharacterized protein (DUF433 family)